MIDLVPLKRPPVSEETVYWNQGDKVFSGRYIGRLDGFYYIHDKHMMTLGTDTELFIIPTFDESLQTRFERAINRYPLLMERTAALIQAVHEELESRNITI